MALWKMGASWSVASGAESVAQSLIQIGKNFVYELMGTIFVVAIALLWLATMIYAAFTAP